MAKPPPTIPMAPVPPPQPGGPPGRGVPPTQPGAPPNMGMPGPPGYPAPHPAYPQVQHPYAQYPYAPRPQVDPRYVGPQWAAPAPYPVYRQPAPPPQARKSSALKIVLLVLGLLVIGPAILFGLFIVAVVSGASSGNPITVPTTTPTTTTPVPVATVAPINKPEVSKTLKGGACTEAANERDEDTYLALRDAGSALRLRGKVAMLHVQLGGGEAAWPKSLTTRMDEAALLSQKFYLDEAKRFGITDLKFDVIPWPLHSAPVQLPNLTTNSHQLLDTATETKLRDEAQAGIETGFGAPLTEIVASYKAKGYDSVGFLVYLPEATDARDFAWRAAKSEASDEPEIAILFPRKDQLDHLSVVAAHEGMHLFGADDLYRMKAEDKADAHDVMGEYCTGFRQTTVDDTTAYAIGWRDKPPSRRYGITDR